MLLDMPSLIGLTITYALIDSVDPCIYALYIALLAPFIINMKKLVATAACFIVSVFTGYLLFNAILRFILTILSPPRWVLSLVLVIYGSAVILYAYLFSKDRDSDVCREDRPLCKFINMLKINPNAISMIGVALLGFIASFTVLPCSAGMAIVFNVTTRSFGFWYWVPLAILYTAVFVLPLIALTLMIIGLTKIDLAYKLMLENQRWIKIGGGLLMICVAVFLNLGIL